MKSIVAALTAVALALTSGVAGAGDHNAPVVQVKQVKVQNACQGYCPNNNVVVEQKSVKVQQAQVKRVVVQEVVDYYYPAPQVVQVQRVQVQNVQVKNAHAGAANVQVKNAGANVKVQAGGGGNVNVKVQNGRQGVLGRLFDR